MKSVMINNYLFDEMTFCTYIFSKYNTINFYIRFLLSNICYLRSGKLKY